MPKLSELGGQVSGGTMKLSELMQSNGGDWRTSNLPGTFGPAGFSGDFRKATNLGISDSLLGSFKPAAADMFGNYDDVVKSLQKVAPGAKLVRDAEGIEAVELPDGKRFALNQKGVDAREVMSGVARVGAFAPAMRGIKALAAVLGGGATAVGAGGLVPSASGALSKALLGGAAGVAGDYIQQKMAGREQIDKTQSALSGGLSAAGELASPIASSLKNVFAKPSNSQLEKLGADALGKLKLNLPDVSPEQLRSLGSMSGEIDAGLSKDAALAYLVSGVKPMRGQIPGDFKNASVLERLKNTAGDSIAGKVVRDTLDQQYKGVDAYRRNIINSMGKTNEPVSPADAVQKVKDAIGKNSSLLDERINEAYAAARNGKAFIPDQYARGLPGKLAASLDDAAVDLKTSPKTTRALEIAHEEMGNATTAVDVLKGFESVRRRLNGLYSSGMDDADKRGLTVAKKSLDDWLGEAVAKGVINGDQEVISSIKKGRELRTKFGQLFESSGAGDKGGKWIEDALSGKSTDELAQAVFGAGQVSPKAAVQVVKRVKDAIGKDPNDAAAFDEFRSAFINKITTGKDGQMMGYQAVSNNIKRFLRDQPELAKVVLKNEERSALINLANASEFYMPKGDFAKSSGTAERLARMTSSLPMVGRVFELMKSPTQTYQALKQTSLPKTNTASFYQAAAAGESAAGNVNRRRNTSR